ncbi:MAG: hypothetical protein ACRDBL_09545 [Rhabdaerophilum sp.]
MLCQSLVSPSLAFMSFIITGLIGLGAFGAFLTIKQGLRDIREGRSLLTGRAK